LDTIYHKPIVIEAGLSRATVGMQPSGKQTSGEGGKKVSPKRFGPQARSQNIRPIRLIPCARVRARKNFFAKKEKNESRGKRFCFVSRKRMIEVKQDCSASFLISESTRVCPVNASPARTVVVSPTQVFAQPNQRCRRKFAIPRRNRLHPRRARYSELLRA